MKTVNIVVPFTLTHSDGKLQDFRPGAYEVEDDIADHWYVVAHSDHPSKPEYKVGTPEYAQESARKIHRRRIADARTEIEEEGDE